MKQTLLVAPVLALALMLAGCKTDHESLANDAISKMEELVKTLKSVQDQASSKAAAPKIKSIAADMKEIADKEAKLDKITDEEKKKLEEKLRPRTEAVTKDFMGEVGRIAMNPALMTTELQTALMDMEKIGGGKLRTR